MSLAKYGIPLVLGAVAATGCGAGPSEEAEVAI